MQRNLTHLASSLSLLPCFAALALAMTPIAAQGADEMAETSSSTVRRPIKISVADAVAMGIENNLQLQVERFDPLLAYEDTGIAWGVYDPTFGGEFGFASIKTPNANALIGTKRTSARTLDGKFGISALIPYLGADINFEIDGDRTDTSSFSTFATIRPEWNTSMSVSGSIPLLKDLVWNEPWTRVKTTAVLYSGAKADFETDLMDIVQLIENSYWNLVASEAAVGVAVKSVEAAASLLDQTKIQYEVGVKSRVEVVEAEAGVAARDVELIRAVNRYRRSQDELIDAVLGTRLTAGSRLEFEPTDDPESYITYEINVVEATDRAFQYRPELEIAELEIERQELQLRFAKNQRLPSLDLQGRFGVSGKGGRGTLQQTQSGPVQNEDTADGLVDTADDWFSPSGGRDFSVRAVLSIPIGSVSGRHTVSRTHLELRRARTRLVRLKQTIILEVRDRARNLESAQEGIEAAERRRLAAAEQLRAERVRLEYGESTPFNVLLKEEDLVEAENEKISALQLYRTSIVDLTRAQGTILKARNIVIDSAAVLR